MFVRLMVLIMTWQHGHGGCKKLVSHHDKLSSIKRLYWKQDIFLSFPWPDVVCLPVIVKVIYHETVDFCSGTYYYKTAPGELNTYEPINYLIRKVRAPRILIIETFTEEQQVTVVGCWLSTQEVFRKTYNRTVVPSFARLNMEARSWLIDTGYLTNQETVKLQVQGKDQPACSRRRVYKVRRNR